MARKYTNIFCERIYLEDILKVRLFSDKTFWYISVTGISDFYRNDPNPVFTWTQSYHSKKVRDRHHEKLLKQLKEIS